MQQPIPASPISALAAASDDGSVLLTAEGLSQTYDGDTFQFRDVGLTVARGAKLGLIGDNGCGKSTLLKARCGPRAAGRLGYPRASQPQPPPQSCRVVRGIGRASHGPVRGVPSASMVVRVSDLVHPGRCRRPPPQVLAGVLPPERGGKVTLRKHTRLVYVEQEPMLPPGALAEDFIFASDAPAVAAARAFREAAA